jgi:hypothetical protein
MRFLKALIPLIYFIVTLWLSFFIGIWLNIEGWMLIPYGVSCAWVVLYITVLLCDIFLD